MGDDAAKALNPIAGRLAEIAAEVRAFSAHRENAEIRERLLETAATLDRVINELAKPRQS